MSEQRDERPPDQAGSQPVAARTDGEPGVEAAEPWTVLLASGEMLGVRWTERQAQEFLRDPARRIVMHDDAGRVVQVVFAAMILLARRGQPSQIVAPPPNGSAIRMHRA